MKVLNKGMFIWVLLLGMNGCISKPRGAFSKEDFMFIAPFTNKDTVIYSAEKGQADTVIFYPFEIDTVKRRSFELGFYDAYVMRVEYELTKGSYHVERFYVGNGDVLYATKPEVFFSVNISTEEFSSRTLNFLSLSFREDELKDFKLDQSGTIVFKSDSKKSSRGIRSFKFIENEGVVSFIDTCNIEWRIKNF